MLIFHFLTCLFIFWSAAFVQVGLSLAGVIVIGMSIGFSFGLSSAAGWEYGPLHSILPFLLLGEFFFFISIVKEMLFKRSIELSKVQIQNLVKFRPCEVLQSQLKNINLWWIDLCYVLALPAVCNAYDLIQSKRMHYISSDSLCDHFYIFLAISYWMDNELIETFPNFLSHTYLFFVDSLSQLTFCLGFVGIGVDDMFVIVGSYQSLSHHELDLPLTQRMGKLLRHAGVSILVTSVTDILAFGIGASTVSAFNK